MLGKAVSICDAKFGTLYLREGDELRLIATHDVPLAFVETQRYTPFRPAPEGMPLAAVHKTKQVRSPPRPGSDAINIECGPRRWTR